MLRQLLSAITPRLNVALAYSSFFENARVPALNGQPAYPEMTKHVELLSLECAFDWLRVNYMSVHFDAMNIISEDQDEPLPIDWAVLVEDWNDTLWIYWLCIVWLLPGRCGVENFLYCHREWVGWMVEMKL